MVTTLRRAPRPVLRPVPPWSCCNCGAVIKYDDRIGWYHPNAGVAPSILCAVPENGPAAAPR
jgi:hypothetical protein